MIEGINIVELIQQMGTGVAFAVVMFLLYRIDRKASEERLVSAHKDCEKRLTELAEDFKGIANDFRSVVNTLIAHNRG